MATFERECWVHAPLDDVWAFHATADGLLALTPEWTDLRVERVIGPDGTPDPDVLEVGSRIEMSVGPVGPRQRWTSEITAREREGATAYFRDVMRDGPFPKWEHTHLFYGDGERTRCRDSLRYRTPTGPFAPLADELAKAVFEAFFAYRHRTLKARFE